MKRRGILALVTVIFLLSSLGCFCGRFNFGGARVVWPWGVRGSGRIAEEERTISGVTGVELATFGDLTIQLGEVEELRIEAEDNLIPYFETDVQNGILVIRQRQNVRLVTNRPVNFYLTVKELESIKISGSGNISAPDLETARFSVTGSGSGDLRMENLEAENGVKVRLNGSGRLLMADVEAETLEVRITGSGDVDMAELAANTLDAELNGSGDLEIAGGQVERQAITITGSGNYRAPDLNSQEADVQLTGSGSATIKVEEHLDAALTGSGNVRYAGNPTVEKSARGSGDVVRVGE